MPSLLHESLVKLFRNRLELAPELLREALSIELPAYAEVRLESAEVTPTVYQADHAVALVDGDPVAAIIVEVQLQHDERKRLTWPVYVTALRARLGCSTYLLVFAPSADVAHRCREPIDVGGSFRLHPLVVGPEAVPVVRSGEEADWAPGAGHPVCTRTRHIDVGGSRGHRVQGGRSVHAHAGPGRSDGDAIL